MKMQLHPVLWFVAAALLITACGRPGSGTGKTIKSAKSGELTVSLEGSSGELKSGENEVLLVFSDLNGNPVDVGAASLNFHMGSMGSMGEMNDRATLTTTEVPGKYRAQVNLQMAGSYEAQIAYEGARGSGQATVNVNVK